MKGKSPMPVPRTLILRPVGTFYLPICATQADRTTDNEKDTGGYGQGMVSLRHYSIPAWIFRLRSGKLSHAGA